MANPEWDVWSGNMAERHRDGRHLNWIADRLVNVYGESENVDFVLRLREIANKLENS